MVRMDVQWICHKCQLALFKKEKSFHCSHCGFVLQERVGYFNAGMPAKLGFTLERTKFLADIELEHFWFAARDRLIHRFFRKIFPVGGRVIEMGCGTGRFLAGIEPFLGELIGVEAFENSIQAAVKRRTCAVLLRGDVCAVPLAGEAFDVVVSMDVLEHVDPDAFLAEAYRLARRGGQLLLSVPAGARLWSEADQQAGHRCRYTLRMLAKELERNGWQLRGYTHYQFLLYPLMVLSRVWLKGRQRIEKHPPSWANRLLGWVNTCEVSLFSKCALPWGSSLIVWAEKL